MDVNSWLPSDRNPCGWNRLSRGGQRHDHHQSLHHPSPFPSLNNLLFCLLVLSLLVVGIQARKPEPIHEFSQHDVFEPQFFDAHGKIDIQRAKALCSSLVSLRFHAFNKTFNVHLKENVHLTPTHYFEKYHENGLPVLVKKGMVQVNDRHCHFTGRLDNTSASWIALSTYMNGIDGVIHEGKELYYIHFNSSSGKHFIFPNSAYINVNNNTCGASNLPNHRNLIGISNRVRRAINTPFREPYKSNYKSRYVELVIVNDHKEYLESNRDKTAIIERSKKIANIVNALYNQLNIFVALVGVVIWSNNDEIKLSSDGDKTLTNFLRYRRERLVPQHPNDNAQLITGTSFDGGVVGKALKGPICTYEYSGGVNTDHSHIIGLVATTVAHELGHNFGMEHDNDKCKCPEDKCIMSPSSGSVSPKYWSSCSIEYLNDAFSHGMDYCLRNPPREIIGPVCGNGFVEDGEECDCGMKEYCDNPCCNPLNCTLTEGSKCASGACCDISSCSIMKSSTVCRKATSECDIPEFCDGKAALCPEDLHIHNGVECGNHNAYCFNGECKSHNFQCKLLWGSSGNVSDMRCFKQNTKGTVSGNCGYHRINQTYIPCKAEDVLCGMLHCAHLSEKLFLGTESAAFLSHSFITVKNKVSPCRSAVIDLGLDSVDPGLVPDGAKCGVNKMCVNQRCVPVESVISLNSCDGGCNGNGFCDNKGKCHCFEGFAPPSCESPLPHGYHLTLALYIIFLCILPLTSFSAFVVYYFHEHIKTWWIVKARKAAIKTRAKESTHRNHAKLPNHFDVRSLEISEPIPVDTGEDIDFGTSSRNNRRKNYRLRESFRNLEISSPMVTQQNTTSNASSAPIKPIRPAPPPPVQKLNRTHSTNSSFSSRRASFNAVRPKSPPPPCPGPRPSTYSSDFSNTKSDLACDTDKVNVHYSTSSMASNGHSTSQQVPSKYCDSNNTSKVAMLAHQFEPKNNL